MTTYSKGYQNKLKKEIKLLEQQKELLHKQKNTEKEIELCNCDNKATVKSLGGEAGDCCWDCYFEMLKRINKIK